MVPVHYLPAYAATSFEFDTTRKAHWVAESLREDPIDGVEISAPLLLERSALLSVHTAEYVDAVASGEPRELAESQGFLWDSRMFETALASTSGTVAAARAARELGVSGSLSSGLHHARPDRGAGFCTFNGLAVATLDALAHGARSVLLIDLDAHGGGGTKRCLDGHDGVWQVDVSVCAVDGYEPTERYRRRVVADAADYLTSIKGELAAIEETGIVFDLCLYNAGVDPYEGCDVGGLAGISAAMVRARDEQVFSWTRRQQIPTAFVLAGGYVGTRLPKEVLVDLHRATIAAAAA